ncbi:MAG: hypothetical protein Kow00117_15320 [Phototrophicales bacterium]
MRLKSLFFALVLLVGTIVSADGLNRPSNSARILTWLNNPDEIVYIAGDGEVIALDVDLPNRFAYAEPCSEQATSPDGRFFTFFAGSVQNGGSLYMVQNADDPVEFAEGVSWRACLGMGTFQYSPDSRQVGYINFDTVNDNTIPSGTLTIRRTNAIQNTTFTAEKVAAFALEDDRVVFVDVTTNGRAIIYQRPTGGETQEIIQLYTDSPNCTFLGAHLSVVDDNTLLLILGQSNRCSTNRWAAYRIDETIPSATRIISGNTGVPAAPGSQIASTTQTLVGLSSANSFYVFYPSGTQGRHTSNLQVVDRVRLDSPDVAASDMVMPSRGSTAASTPVVSLNRAYAAMVNQTADVDSTIYLFSLGNSTRDPIRIDGGSIGETISSMVFSADSRQFVYVSGGINGAENGLYRVTIDDAQSGVSGNRVERGNYAAPMVISPDGNYVALGQWQGSGNDRYVSLIAVELKNGEATELFEGRAIPSDRETERLAVPLSWRR